MTLKKPMIMFIVLSLVTTLLVAAPQPAVAAQGDCPDNTVFLAKYNWSGTAWVWDDKDGSQDIITFGPNSDGVGPNAYKGSWTSLLPIAVLVMTDGHIKVDGELIAVGVDWFYPSPTTGPEDYDSADMEPEIIPPREISNLFFCGPVWPVSLASFKARANQGKVAISWSTATEINNAGFILFRSATLDGPKVQVNGNLVAAQGSGVTGASYSFTDSPGYGSFFYWLADVDYSGLSSLHGPVRVNVLPAIRQPTYRPSLPGR